MGIIRREYLTGILILVNGAISLTSIKNVSIAGFDCRTPREIRTFDRAQFCPKPGKVVNREQKVTVIQRDDVTTHVALRCKQRESKFLIYCGAYSHMKLLRSPVIDQTVEVTVAECQRMMTTQTIILRNGKAQPLTIGKRTVFSYIEHGTAEWDSTNFKCNGATIMFQGEQHENTMVYISGSIELTKVDIKYSKGKVIDATDHVGIKSTCKDNCIDNEATYVRVGHQSECKLKKIRQISMMRVQLGTEEYVISHGHKLLLNLGKRVSPPEGCGIGNVIQTQYKDLLVSFEDGGKLSTITGDGVNLDLELRTTSEYLQYYTEHMIQGVSEGFKKRICEREVNLNDGINLSPFHEGYLIRSRGDIFQELKCNPVKVNAMVNTAPVDHCYRHALPVYLGNELVLLDTQSRTIYDLGEKQQIPCAIMFPDLVYDVTRSILIYADPVIRVNSDIKVIQAGDWSKGEPNHEKINLNLLYTTDEMVKYSNLLHFQRVRDSVLSDIVSNVCSGDKNRCGFDSGFVKPTLNWHNLVPEIPVLLPFEKVMKYMKNAGSLGGVIFLMYVIFQAMYRVMRALNKRLCPHGRGGSREKAAEQITVSVSQNAAPKEDAGRPPRDQLQMTSSSSPSREPVIAPTHLTPINTEARPGEKSSPRPLQQASPSQRRRSIPPSSTMTNRDSHRRVRHHRK